MLKPNQIRDLNINEIKTRIEEEEREYEDLRFEHSIHGRLENPMLLRTKRRLIARLKTILNEKRQAEPTA